MTTTQQIKTVKELLKESNVFKITDEGIEFNAPTERAFADISQYFKYCVRYFLEDVLNKYAHIKLKGRNTLTDFIEITDSQIDSDKPIVLKMENVNVLMTGDEVVRVLNFQRDSDTVVIELIPEVYFNANNLKASDQKGIVEIKGQDEKCYYETFKPDQKFYERLLEITIHSAVY